MKIMSPPLKLLLNATICQSIIHRRFDGRLISLGLNEFIILYQLEQSEGQKMRRIDLAESVGLTASGVTRLLAPMEKIGLVKREANKNDARVSFVALATGGKKMLADSMENAEALASDLLSSCKEKDIEISSSILKLLGGTIQ